MHPQLTLPLGIVPSSSFANFYAGQRNQTALNSISAFAAGQGDEKQLFIWGALGVGKSHLLSATCQKAVESNLQVSYLTGELANHPHALDGLEHSDIVCIDDIQCLNNEAQTELFHCINRCRAGHTRLLLSADNAIENLGFALPDLRTRLSWGPVFHLQLLEDAELRQALSHVLQSRDLVVNDDVMDYLLRHFPRDIARLKALIDELDNASMRAKRRITIPLIRGVLQ